MRHRSDTSATIYGTRSKHPPLSKHRKQHHKKATPRKSDTKKRRPNAGRRL